MSEHVASYNHPRVCLNFCHAQVHQMEIIKSNVQAKTFIFRYLQMKLTWVQRS